MHHPAHLLTRTTYFLATILITLLTTTSFVLADTSRSDLIKASLSPDHNYSLEAYISSGMHRAVVSAATAESLITLLSQQLKVYSYADTDHSPLSLNGFKVILADSAIILDSVNELNADDLLEVRENKVLMMISPPTQDPDGQKKIISIDPHQLQQIHKELAASLNSADSQSTEPSASDLALENFLSAVSEHIHHRSFGSTSNPSHGDEAPNTEDTEVTETTDPSATHTSEDEEQNLFTIQAFVGDLTSHQNLSYKAGENLMAKLLALPSFNLSFEPVSYFNQIEFMNLDPLDHTNLAIQFFHSPPAGKIAFVTYSQKLVAQLSDSGHITPNDHLALFHISIDDFLKTFTKESLLSTTEMSKTDLFLSHIYLDVIATKKIMKKQAKEKAGLDEESDEDNEDNKEDEGAGDTLPDSSTDTTGAEDNSSAASKALAKPMHLTDGCLKIRRNHKPTTIAQDLSSTSFADYRRSQDIARRNTKTQNTLASAQKSLVKQTLNALLFNGGDPANNVTVTKQAGGTIIEVCSNKTP